MGELDRAPRQGDDGDPQRIVLRALNPTERDERKRVVQLENTRTGKTAYFPPGDEADLREVFGVQPGARPSATTKRRGPKRTLVLPTVALLVARALRADDAIDRRWLNFDELEIYRDRARARRPKQDSLRPTEALTWLEELASGGLLVCELAARRARLKVGGEFEPPLNTAIEAEDAAGEWLRAHAQPRDQQKSARSVPAAAPFAISDWAPRRLPLRPTLAAPRQRLFSSLYDSSFQSQCFAEYGPTAAVGAFQASLRLDALLWNQVVLTDAQVLDGQFFQSFGLGDAESNLADTMARLRRSGDDAPFVEIRSRSDRGAADALVAMVRGKGDTLRKLVLSSEPDVAARQRVATALTRIAADEVTQWQDLPGVLRKAGANADSVARMSAGWAHWIEAEQRGLVRFVKWEPTFVGHLPKGLRMEDMTALWAQQLATGEGRHKAADLFARAEGLIDRSAVYTELDDEARNANLAALDELIHVPKRAPLADDLLRIRAWYDRGYNRALAWQHGAESAWVADRRAPHSRVEQSVFDLTERRDNSGLLEEARRRGILLEIPVDFMEFLRDLPHKEFHHLVATNDSVVRHFREWYRAGSLSDLQFALDPLMTEFSKYRAGNGCVPRFSHATQVRVRAALTPVMGIGLGSIVAGDLPAEVRSEAAAASAFEIDSLIVDQRSGETTQVVVESFSAVGVGK